MPSLHSGGVIWIYLFMSIFIGLFVGTRYIASGLSSTPVYFPPSYATSATYAIVARIPLNKITWINHANGY